MQTTPDEVDGLNLVFCADRRMLAGLHVATHSVLIELASGAGAVTIALFSADLNESDADLLRTTLNTTGRTYSLRLYQIDGKRFEGFPELQASYATYFRLVVPEVLEVERFLYLDADILCRTDLSALNRIDLGGHPIALVPEAPIHQCADPDVARLLGERARGNYYNAGVMLVDAVAWRREDLTRRCLDFIQEQQPRYHDQSALNFVLHGNIHSLPPQYNCRTNARENWPALIHPNSGQGMLLHFVDFPKPWSPLGCWAHPMGRLWWRSYLSTHHSTSSVRLNKIGCLLEFRVATRSYRKSIKDLILFRMFESKIIKSIKGI